MFGRWRVRRPLFHRCRTIRTRRTRVTEATSGSGAADRAAGDAGPDQTRASRGLGGRLPSAGLGNRIQGPALAWFSIQPARRDHRFPASELARKPRWDIQVATVGA